MSATLNAAEIANLKRNLDNTSYNEGSHDLACRLSDCKTYIEQLEIERDTFRHGYRIAWDNCVRLEFQLAALSAELNLRTHQVITCGVAASHPDANLSRTGAYAGKWNSAQAEEVRVLRDQLSAASAQGEPAYYKWLDTTGVMRFTPYVPNAARVVGNITPLYAHPATAVAQGEPVAPDDIIKEMVNRFLGWKLPKDFYPDCGISFTPESDYDHPQFGRYKFEPIGTNLFTAGQARAMFMHCLAGVAAHPAPSVAPTPLSDHDAGIIKDIEVMAATKDNGFWPQALAIGALRLIRRPAHPVPSIAADQVRDAALEEAAKQCEDIYSWKGAFSAGPLHNSDLNTCASAIRALKSAPAVEPAGDGK